MQRGHDLRAFADGRGHAFGGFRAHVANGKHATPRRLQRMARTVGILAGLHEAFGIERNA